MSQSCGMYAIKGHSRAAEPLCLSWQTRNFCLFSFLFLYLHRHRCITGGGSCASLVYLEKIGVECLDWVLLDFQSDAGLLLGT